MALDIFVGSLTRYHAGEWETVGERAARERSRGEPMARPRGPASLVGDSSRIGAAVMAWRSALARRLGNRIDEPFDWEEAIDAPWSTARPGWDGFGSLMLWAAYAEHPGRRRPDMLPEPWDGDPVYLRVNDEGFRSRYAQLIRPVELWLPVPFDFTFEAATVDGRRTILGSLVALRRQLAELNEATWKANLQAIAGWVREVPAEETLLEARARYAFSVLSDLVQWAVARRLPMKLDY